MTRPSAAFEGMWQQPPRRSARARLGKISSALGRTAWAGKKVKEVIRIGPDGYLDPSGLLRGLLEEKGGWILVRPDGHVAWAQDRLEGLGDAVRYALGVRN